EHGVPAGNRERRCLGEAAAGYRPRAVGGRDCRAGGGVMLRKLLELRVYLGLLGIALVMATALYMTRTRSIAVAAAYERQAELAARGAELRGASQYLTDQVRR